MKWLFGPAAVMALGGAMLPVPPAVADATPANSTQIVNISLDGSFCPQHGLYGIAHVTVDGTAGMRADQNFIWTTQTAATSIQSVPPGGAVANFTIVYHCNVQVLWWLEPGNARRVTAGLWVNGSSPQPNYIIRPARQASQVTTLPTSSQPQALQPTTVPSTPLTPSEQPSTPQALQPTTVPSTLPITPLAPSQASSTPQAPQSTPALSLPPTTPLPLTPTPPHALQPIPSPSLPLALTPTPPHALQPTPSPSTPQAPAPPPALTPTPSPSLTPTPTPPQTLQPTPSPSLPLPLTSSPDSQPTTALMHSPTPTP